MAYKRSWAGGRIQKHGPAFGLGGLLTGPCRATDQRGPWPDDDNGDMAKRFPGCDCHHGEWPMKSWQSKEVQARRAIEDQGFVVHDANVLFRANCPNIDLVVFGKNAATYV
jgi:hypothetical protein